LVVGLDCSKSLRRSGVSVGETGEVGEIHMLSMNLPDESRYPENRVVGKKPSGKFGMRPK
jgi:hypothetical protein